MPTISKQTHHSPKTLQTKTHILLREQKPLPSGKLPWLARTKLTQLKYILPISKNEVGEPSSYSYLSWLIPEAFLIKTLRLRKSSQKNPFLREKGKNLPKHATKRSFFATIRRHAAAGNPKKTPSLEDKGTWFAVAKMMFDRSLRWSFQYLTRFVSTVGTEWDGLGRLVGTGVGKTCPTVLGCFFGGHNERPYENWWFFRKGDLTTLFMVGVGNPQLVATHSSSSCRRKCSSIAHLSSSRFGNSPSIYIYIHTNLHILYV